MKIRNIKQITAFLIAFFISFAIAYSLYFSYNSEKTLSREISTEDKIFENPLPLKNVLFVITQNKIINIDSIIRLK